MSVKIIELAKIQAIDAGGGSWLKELLTGNTVGSKKAMLGYSTFTPGTNTEQKIHTEEEHAFILKGKGFLTVRDQKIGFQKDSALFIPPGVPHGILNEGPEDVVMVYVFSHPQYPPTQTFKDK